MVSQNVEATLCSMLFGGCGLQYKHYIQRQTLLLTADVNIHYTFRIAANLGNAQITGLRVPLSKREYARADVMEAW